MTSRARYLSSFQNLRQPTQREELRLLTSGENPCPPTPLRPASPQLNPRESAEPYSLLGFPRRFHTAPRLQCFAARGGSRSLKPLRLRRASHPCLCLLGVCYRHDIRYERFIRNILPISTTWEGHCFAVCKAGSLQRTLHASLPGFGIHWGLGRQAALQAELKKSSKGA